MAQILIKFDKALYYAPTGLGKSDYIKIINNESILNYADRNVFEYFLLNVNNSKEENDFIVKFLDEIGDICNRISKERKLIIVDKIYNKIPEHYFILINYNEATRLYSLKRQFVLAIKDQMPKLKKMVNEKNDNTITANSITDTRVSKNNITKQTTKSYINDNSFIDKKINESSALYKTEANKDIKYLQRQIELKQKAIEEAFVKINVLKNQPLNDDSEIKIQEIENENQLLVFRRTRCELEIENIISKITEAIGEEKKKLYDKNKELIEEINGLKSRIFENEHKISILKKSNLNDSNNSEIIKLEAVISGLEESIKEIKEEIKSIENNKPLGIFNETNSTSYNLSNSTVQRKVIIDSQYVDLPYFFEITNVSYLTKSKSDYKSIYAVIFNILTRGKRIKRSHIIVELSEYELSIVYQLQILVLMLLRNGELGDDLWVFDIADEYKKYMEIAANDILSWAEQLTSLTKLLFEKPQIEYRKENAITILFDTYSSDKNTYCINISTIKEDIIVPIWIENRIDYTIDPQNKDHRTIMNEILQSLFGFTAFREGQLEIISNFLKNKNTLGILTTGGGKSLTYYISVLLQPKISLVIAPINSLIKDQTDSLSSRYGIDRYAILTGDNPKMSEDLYRFKKGQTLFTFASPERLQNNKFRQILIDHSYSKTIGSVILDEVHCLSEWGHDFRVPYLMLSTTLNSYCEGVYFLGLTATASINVVRDLMIELNIKEEDVKYSTNLKRPNLTFDIRRYRDYRQALSELKTILNKNYRKNTQLDIYKYNDSKNSIIVFSRTKGGKTGVEALYSEFSEQFPNHVGMYHGDKKDEQDAFMTDEYTLLFATKAFGMGIDKPNVRATFHFGMPESREAYYQEAGRAGRDGEKAECILLSYTSTEHDRIINQFFSSSTSLESQRSIMQSLRGTDISTNFYFYLEDIETLNEEVEQSIKLIEMLEGHKNYIFDIRNGMKNKTEKYLYILHKLGIVKNWEVSFAGLKNVSFKVEVNPFYKEIEHIKKSSLFYIHAYRNHSSEENNELERDKRYQQIINSVDHIKDIHVIIHAIREWYYFTFTTTRRIKLENMYKLVSEPTNNGKIQDILEKAFDISQTIGKTKEGYSLSFESNTLDEVINFAFQLDEALIENRIISVEHLLESVTSNKVRLYLAILLLRFDKTNSADIIHDIYNTFNENERKMFINALSENYQSLSQKHRMDLLNIIQSIDKVAVSTICKTVDMDEVIYIYVTNQIIDTLGKGW